MHAEPEVICSIEFTSRTQHHCCRPRVPVRNTGFTLNVKAGEVLSSDICQSNTGQPPFQDALFPEWKKECHILHKESKKRLDRVRNPCLRSVLPSFLRKNCDSVVLLIKIDWGRCMKIGYFQGHIFAPYVMNLHQQQTSMLLFCTLVCAPLSWFLSRSKQKLLFWSVRHLELNKQAAGLVVKVGP